jgi:hypothetical protein
VRPQEERERIAAGRRRPLVQRFWLKVDTTAGDDGCWPWTGATNRYGYGTIGIEHDRAKGVSRTGLAHRVAWELLVGPIPTCGDSCHRTTCDECLTVDHLCFTRSCVNPKHLQLVTHRVNRERRRTKN